MSTWGIHESGMITQSIPDMIDGDVRIFTEAAADHNQTIRDAKEGEKPFTGFPPTPFHKKKVG